MSLLMCPLSSNIPIGATVCSHAQDVGISCQPQIFPGTLDYCLALIICIAIFYSWSEQQFQSYLRNVFSGILAIIITALCMYQLLTAPSIVQTTKCNVHYPNQPLLNQYICYLVLTIL